MIERGNIDQIIEVEFVLREGAHLGDLFGIRHDYRDLATKFRWFRDEISKLVFQLLGKFRGGHHEAQSALSDSGVGSK